MLWREPLSLIDTLSTMARHPTHNSTLFRGELVWWPNLPWDYFPTWMLITTPPIALALAALGIVYAARLCAADRRGVFDNSTARFGLLTAACLIAPAAAVIALDSNLYNGWRHVYFLYAPICVLAAFGLRDWRRCPSQAFAPPPSRSRRSDSPPPPSKWLSCTPTKMNTSARL